MIVKRSLKEVPSAEEPKRVKPENFNELPRSAQVYFFIHKAIESGEEFAEIPVKRGICAIGINEMKNKKSYRQTLKSLRVAIAMRR